MEPKTVTARTGRAPDQKSDVRVYAHCSPNLQNSTSTPKSAATPTSVGSAVAVEVQASSGPVAQEHELRTCSNPLQQGHDDDPPCCFYCKNRPAEMEVNESEFLCLDCRWILDPEP